MSEKLRNENMGESQREEMVQRDVKSPSASKFDDKKEFFENVMSKTSENVPTEEILTEQKKEICEDLKSIGQNEKGESFEDKKEFFENVMSDQSQDTLLQSQNKTESQKEELKPKEEWRNKYEGESKSPIDSSMKQEEGKESPLQQKEECKNKNEKERSFEKDEKDVPSQSGVPSMTQGQQGKESSFGTESPMKQMKEEKEPLSQQKEEDWKNKNEKERNESPMSQYSSQIGSSPMTQGQQGQESSLGSGVSSMRQGQQGKESSFGTESPMKQMKEGKEPLSEQKEEECKNKNEKERSFERDVPSQSGVPSMTQGQLGNESSFGTGSPKSQGKDTAFGSFFPNEKSTSLQSDLINFGQQNEWEKQRSFPQGQEGTFGSGVPPMTEGQQGQVSSFGSGDSSMLQGNNQEFVGSGIQSPKDKNEKCHPHPRIKGFEPKDPLQTKEFDTENKDK